MKILMLSDVYFPRVNGVSTSIRTFAKSLIQLGHSVSLVVPDYGPNNGQADHDTEFGGNFEVLRLPARQIFFDPEDRLIKSRALREVLPLLSRRHWDAIHVHTPFRAHQLGVRLSQACGAPLVETYHTYFEEYVAHYLPLIPPSALRFMARGVSRRMCHEVDHLIVPTTEMTDVLNRYGIRTPTTVLPTGIDLTEFSGGNGDAFRSRHGINPLQPVLVTVSRLAAEKNIEFLLRMACSLVVEFPDLLFVIAGEGPDAPRLKALAVNLGLDGHVRFFGNLDRRTDLLDCYRAADAFVFASPTETQGLVLIEAMALGAPIVSTAVMGTAAVLRGATSAVVSEQNETAFAASVARVLLDPVLRASLSAAGPRDAQAWSSDALMRQAVDLYASLVRTPSNAAPENAGGRYPPIRN